MTQQETTKTVFPGFPGTYVIYDKSRYRRGKKPWILKDIETDAIVASFPTKRAVKYFIEQII